MNYYRTLTELNIRDKPNGQWLGTMRPETIAYALAEPIQLSETWWVNVFAYDTHGIWINGFSAISQADTVFMEAFVPHVKLGNPYRGETHVTQLFGENPAMYQSTFPGLGLMFHNGIDFSGLQNTQIYSVAPGVVEVGFDARGYGHFVKITGATLTIVYAHMRDLQVNSNQYIEPGTLIGFESNSGGEHYGMGKHLHIEVRNKNLYNYDNGALGRIDLLPYLDWSNITFPNYCSILNTFK